MTPRSSRVSWTSGNGLAYRSAEDFPLCQKRSNAVQLPDEPRLQTEPFNDVDNRLIRGWELQGLVVVLKHIVPHVALETPLTYGHNAP
jgi:hypothetical protein